LSYSLPQTSHFAIEPSSRMCLSPLWMNDLRSVKSLCSRYSANYFDLDISATVTSLTFKYILHVGVVISEPSSRSRNSGPASC
jgi:hypothetical protein